MNSKFDFKHLFFGFCSLLTAVCSFEFSNLLVRSSYE
jgi:hypothetical protein